MRDRLKVVLHGFALFLLGFAIGFAIVFAIVDLVIHWHPVQHWVAIHTGTESAGPDRYYNWWSGFGSDIGEVTLIVAILTPATMAARHHNCHTRGCWRITMHKLKDPETGAEYRQCHKHHPALCDHHHEHWWQHHFSDEHMDDVRGRAMDPRRSS